MIQKIFSVEKKLKRRYGGIIFFPSKRFCLTVPRKFFRKIPASKVFMHRRAASWFYSHDQEIELGVPSVFQKNSGREKFNA